MLATQTWFRTCTCNSSGATSPFLRYAHRRRSPLDLSRFSSKRLIRPCLSVSNFCFIQAKDAHVGVVKSYTAPASPQAPSLPSDLSAELSKFDATEPTLASAPAAATQDVSADAGEGNAGAKEYLAFLEKDLPKADAHH